MRRASFSSASAFWTFVIPPGGPSHGADGSRFGLPRGGWSGQRANSTWGDGEGTGEYCAASSFWPLFRSPERCCNPATSDGQTTSGSSPTIVGRAVLRCDVDVASFNPNARIAGFKRPDLSDFTMLPSQLQDSAHRPWPLPPGAWIMRMIWEDLLFIHWPVPV